MHRDDNAGFKLAYYRGGSRGIYRGEAADRHEQNVYFLQLA
jgi:hypothetical protein